MTSLVPESYGDLVDRIGAEVRTTRLRAARAANTELVAMNWRIGRLILDRQQTEPWGSGGHQTARCRPAPRVPAT